MNVVGVLQHESDVHSVPAGEYVFHEGDHGTEMYVVEEGQINIVIRGRVIEEIGPGGIFGEMALIDSQPRTADALAAVASKIAKVDADRFMYLAKLNPYFSLDVLRVTVERLRRHLAETHG